MNIYIRFTVERRLLQAFWLPAHKKLLPKITQLFSLAPTLPRLRTARSLFFYNTIRSSFFFSFPFSLLRKWKGGEPLPADKNQFFMDSLLKSPSHASPKNTNRILINLSFIRIFSFSDSAAKTRKFQLFNKWKSFRASDFVDSISKPMLFLIKAKLTK